MIQFLAQYADKIALSLFTSLTDKTEDNLVSLRQQTYELILQETEQFIEKNLVSEILRKTFQEKLAQALEKEDEDGYEELLLTYLQLVPDMAFLFHSRMQGLEAVLKNKIRKEPLWKPQ